MQDKVLHYLKSLGLFKIFITLFILGLLYGATSLYLKYMYFSKFMNQTRVTSVKASPVEIDIAQYSYRALSVIESNDSVDITSKVNGIIDQIFFEERTFVKKGEPLYSIISSDTVGSTKIHAPFAGIAGLSKKQISENVSKGQTLTSLDNYEIMKLPLDLPERLLPYLNKRLSFLATTDNLPNYEYNGELEFIDTRINTQTRTIEAYALVDNSSKVLMPGLLMKVDIFLEENNNAILIPEESLLSINQKHYVYKVVEDAAELTEVQIGIKNNSVIEIKSGLDINDVVIFMGQEKLKDGSKIKILN
jgi:multidrug efflux pump subunit AcrA (membrane-fusion protein)